MTVGGLLAGSLWLRYTAPASRSTTGDRPRAAVGGGPAVPHARSRHHRRPIGPAVAAELVGAMGRVPGLRVADPPRCESPRAARATRGRSAGGSASGRCSRAASGSPGTGSVCHPSRERGPGLRPLVGDLRPARRRAAAGARQHRPKRGEHLRNGAARRPPPPPARRVPRLPSGPRGTRRRAGPPTSRTGHCGLQRSVALDSATRPPGPGWPKPTCASWRRVAGAGGGRRSGARGGGPGAGARQPRPAGAARPRRGADAVRPRVGGGAGGSAAGPPRSSPAGPATEHRLAHLFLAEGQSDSSLAASRAAIATARSTPRCGSISAGTT